MKEVGAFPAVLIKLSISWESGLDGVKSHLQEKREGGKKILAVQYGLTNHLGSYKRQIEQQISGLWNLDNPLEKTKIKSNNCEIWFSSFSFFFHPGPFYCCSRQQGIVLLLEAKCSFWEHFAKRNRTRHDTLEANRDTSPPEGSHGGDRPGRTRRCSQHRPGFQMWLSQLWATSITLSLQTPALPED